MSTALTVTVPDGLTVQRTADDGTGLDRYDIVHVHTGRLVTVPAGNRCARHLEQALALFAATGIDWTLADPATPNAERCRTLRRQLLELGRCFDLETGRARPCAGEEQPTR